MVLNDTRVIPARLLGRKQGSGGRVELLLVRPDADVQAASALTGPAGAVSWVCLGQASKGLREGTVVGFEDGSATVLEALGEGELRVRFEAEGLVAALLERAGRVPLPPYVAREATPEDRIRYQTVYARADGSVAAPTAGLHLTAGTFATLEERGVERRFVTLDVGPGTFLPVRGDDESTHRMHAERYFVPDETAEAVNRARREGRRVVAVGTTVVRTLESAVEEGRVRPGAGSSRLFIRPPATRSRPSTRSSPTSTSRADAPDARLGVRRAGGGPRRLPGGRHRALPLLQLWRCDVHRRGSRALSLRFERLHRDTGTQARAGAAAHAPRHGRDAGLHAGRDPGHGEGDSARTTSGTLGEEILLGNTYHLMLRPGPELVGALGGLHPFMAWDRPILTDSGGFQVFSLARSRKSPRRARASSRTSMGVAAAHAGAVDEIQETLGADIIMAFDECAPSRADRAYLEESLARTTRWLHRAPPRGHAVRARSSASSRVGSTSSSAAGTWPSVRGGSAWLRAGRLLGGREPRRDARLGGRGGSVAPRGPPRYLMGVGTPVDS